MIRSFIILSILFSFFHTSANDCKCCTEQHKQFDFLIGEWDVYDEEGNMLGSSTIKSLLDHCVLQEKMELSNINGISNFFLDSKILEWKQLWIDNQDYTHELSGSFVNGRMLLKSRVRMYSDGVDEVIDEVSWKENEDGSFIQRWIVRSVSGKVLERNFSRVYKPKG